MKPPSNTLSLGKSYLAAWNRKDLNTISNFIHPEIHFIGAMTECHNAQDFLNSVKSTLPLLKQINIRSEFANNDEVVFLYDFICIDPIGLVRVAENIQFADDKIKKIELFFDARPFEKLFANQG